MSAVTSSPASSTSSGGRRTHAGDRLQHEALAGAAGAEQHRVGAVLDRQADRSHAEAAGLHLESTQLDHGAPVFERRRGAASGTTAQARNTTNATMTMSTAGGCAARSPKPSNRSNVSTEMTLGL